MVKRKKGILRDNPGQQKQLKNRVGGCLTSILLLCFCVSLSTACQSMRTTARLNEPIDTHILPLDVKASNGFRVFWSRLQGELKGNDIKNFIPSKEFAEEFGLQLTNGRYYLSGILRVDSLFAPESVSSLEGSTSKYTDSIYTFRIPVQRLMDLLNVKGLERIENSTKVYMK